MVEGRHALELGEDGVFVGKEVADKSAGVLLFHCERSFCSWAEDAWCQVSSQRRNIFLISRCKIDKASKVIHAGIQSGNVGQS